MKTKMTSIDSWDKKREECIAEYICDTGATVRAAAVFFGISKSTVHKDVTTRLRASNYSLYKRTKLVLERNKAERHIRGGEATRKMYIEKRKNQAN